METKVGNYIIIDKHNENLKDVKKRRLDLIFKFIDDKTIEILDWAYEIGNRKIINYFPYNNNPDIIIYLKDSEECKKNFLDKKFIEFLEKKGNDTIKNFYKAKKKYESLLNKRVKDAYTYHFVSFDNISFVRAYPSTYNDLVYFNVAIDNKTKKNSLITHFYYKEKLTLDYSNDDPYTQLVKMINPIMKKLERSGFNKYEFYFDIYTPIYREIYYWFHCVPMKPKPIDSKWFYILSFYISVLLNYIMGNDTIKDCYNYYNQNLFHKDMNCYDIMDILIEKNLGVK